MILLIFFSFLLKKFGVDHFKSLYWICYNIVSASHFDFFAHEARGTLALQPGITPVTPALEGRVLSTGQPVLHILTAKSPLHIRQCTFLTPWRPRESRVLETPPCFYSLERLPLAGDLLHFVSRLVGFTQASHFEAVSESICHRSHNFSHSSSQKKQVLCSSPLCIIRTV